VYEDFPQLPQPSFAVIQIQSGPDVPALVRNELLTTGIPAGLIGYEYRPLAEAVYIGGIREAGLVAIATCGLLGRICIDAATGEIVQIPTVEARLVTHVNRDLGAFTRCVSAVITRFPFYDENDGDEKFRQVAQEIRQLIGGIDETALVHNGFWHSFSEDIAMGDYSSWN
jgi:hypothetical protein